MLSQIVPKMSKLLIGSNHRAVVLIVHSNVISLNVITTY